MQDVLGEHQFIMLENFETIYFSTNLTVPLMSQSFIAGSAILCHFMPNDRSLWVSSLIPSIPPQKLLCRLKLALNTRHKVRMSWGRGGLVVYTSDSGSRGRGFEPHSGLRVVSLSKTYLPPKSAGNTQEAVALSQHD